MICVLVQAGEGETQAIIVGKSEVELIESVIQYYQIEIEFAEKQDNKDFAKLELAALLQMLAVHINWEPGRYVLPCVSPHWEEWTLLIA